MDRAMRDKNDGKRQRQKRKYKRLVSIHRWISPNFWRDTTFSPRTLF